MCRYENFTWVNKFTKKLLNPHNDSTGQTMNHPVLYFLLWNYYAIVHFLDLTVIYKKFFQIFKIFRFISFIITNNINIIN